MDTDLRPTNELRFVLKDGEKILQQKFEVWCLVNKSDSDGGRIYQGWANILPDEWKDVPVC